ncbi:molybdopterin molybdenumtransferase MoeA [Sphingomonas ginkgonis]|uniref:Molybdopterin molybdenumtransferase n=1 Tax=Sphingomonas ginkgonis TaxID=2315330 RepID=A0A429V6I3_9SPHN|nr:molybdopterin molybdotransferase MoeA [Sphingomonas ginkgonis]RST29546.1 molybdopterin molybdenumtransferase MoeA [Sphingomonas ginkgonis]
MIGFDEASAILAAVSERTPVETVPIAEAAGRVLAAALTAALDSPRSDVSAMDGYAVRSDDLSALPARLPVDLVSYPGGPGLPPLGPSQCARIFTGAPLPPGADRVIMQEDVEREGDVAVIAGPPGPSPHVRARASDFAAGTELLSAGTRLTPTAIVTAAAADAASLPVHGRPRMIILGTGDELAAPGTARERPRAIPESLSLGVAAMAERWGATCLAIRRLPDEPATLERAAAEALEETDIVVVTGGASVGEKDFAKAMFAPAGLELLFSKVAIKPGKPVWLGRARGRLVLGLPGNPSSAMVTARLFLVPLLLRLSGGDPAEGLRWRPVPLGAALPAGGAREEFVRAAWRDGAAEPLGDQVSGSQRPLANAELLLRRPAGCDATEAGSNVPALWFE